MISKKRKIEFFVIGIITTALLVPSTLIINEVDAVHFGKKADLVTLPSAGDTVGDIQIRAMFYFNSGTEEINSFRIFNQMEGYDLSAKPKLELTGGVGPDKQMLYHITDMSHHQAHESRGSQFQDFDIDVYLMHEDHVYRKLVYSRCDVIDYTILTLHDGDETFSGKTKFVVADQFIFECEGYHPHCPSCEGETSKTSTKQYSSLDYQREQKLLRQPLDQR